MLYAELGKAAQTLSTGHLANPKGGLSTLCLFNTTQVTNNFCSPCMKGTY